MRKPDTDVDVTHLVETAISIMKENIPDMWDLFFKASGLQITVSDEEEEEIYYDIFRFVSKNNLNNDIPIFSFMSSIIRYTKKKQGLM